MKYLVGADFIAPSADLSARLHRSNLPGPMTHRHRLRRIHAMGDLGLFVAGRERPVAGADKSAVGTLKRPLRNWPMGTGIGPWEPELAHENWFSWANSVYGFKR